MGICAITLDRLFLITNFRNVLNVLCFLLGNSLASECYTPVFRDILFCLHRRVGVKNDWRWERWGVYRGKGLTSTIPWLTSRRHTSFTYAPGASVWVVALHSPFLYSDPPLPCNPPSEWLGLFSSQTFSCINTPTFSTPHHSFYLPTYEDGTDRVFRNIGI
jgi:hypothetical protein